MGRWEQAKHAAGLEPLDPHASRSQFYGTIISGTIMNAIGIAVVGLWARGAIMWTHEYKLYAAMAFWLLWKLPTIVQQAIEIANRSAPKCPDCGHT